MTDETKTANPNEVRFPIDGNTNKKLVRRILYLAWKAASPVGLGILQALGAGEKTEEEVFSGVIGQVDYPHAAEMWPLKGGEFHADYVFGHMMKLNITVKDGVLAMGYGSAPRPDYQSWCGAYPTYQALLDAALESLEVKDA